MSPNNVQKTIIGMLTAIALLVSFSFGISRGSESASNRSTSGIDQMLLDEINALRAEKGLDPLTADKTLKAYAATRSKEISKKWSHIRPDGTHGANMVDKDKYRGENLAYVHYPRFDFTELEQEAAVEAEMDNLKASKTHYDNMMYEGFTKVGIRTYMDDTSDGVTLYTAYLFSS